MAKEGKKLGSLDFIGLFWILGFRMSTYVANPWSKKRGKIKSMQLEGSKKKIVGLR